MTFEELSEDEQDRVVLAELIDRRHLFAEAGGSSMPVRFSEIDIVLNHALAHLGPREGEHDDNRSYSDPKGWAAHVAACEQCRGTPRDPRMRIHPTPQRGGEMSGHVRSTKGARIWRRFLVALFLGLALYSPIRAADADGWWQAYYVASGVLWLWWAVAGIVRISRESKEGE